MAILTFMSDFGIDDHYVAAVKAKILSIDPTITIVDLSHTIAQYDIAHGAFVLGSVFRDFPLGTVHLATVDTVPRLQRPFIAARLEGHFFVARDSGLLSLISEYNPDEVVKLDASSQAESTFPERDFLALVAVEIRHKGNLAGLGESYTDLYRLINRQVKATKKQMSGHVVHVDHYGNLITNLKFRDFDAITRLNGETGFVVRVGRENFFKMNRQYHEVDSGEVYVLFNSLGVLQIGINKGNASELLGLGFDSPITIDFGLN